MITGSQSVSQPVNQTGRPTVRQEEVSTTEKFIIMGVVRFKFMVIAQVLNIPSVDCVR